MLDNTKILMPDKRVASSASLVSGKIYVIGGWNYVGSNIVTYGNVWEYDPATDTWDDTTRMDMPTPRAYLSTNVIDGKIYAFGGSNETTALSTVEVYDPFTNTWTPKSDMPAGRTYLMTSAVEDSLIYIFGGSTSPFDKPMSDAWAYNPGSDKFKAVSPMPTGLITSTCNAVDEKIYIIGGSRTPWIFQSDSLLLEYDPHNDSSSSLTAIEKWDTNLPTAFSLSQNYPNPFNPTTTIEFSIPNSEFITLKIYNLLGQEVAILVSEKLKTGSYKYTWDATHYSSGIYYYKIKASKFEKTEKMILLQ